MPTDLVVHSSIPTFTGDRLAVVPVNVSSVPNLSRLKAQADPAGAGSWTDRPMSFIPTSYDADDNGRDGKVFAGVCYVELQDDDQGVKIIDGDTAVLPTPPTHNPAVQLWAQVVAQSGLEFVVVDHDGRRYVAPLGGGDRGQPPKIKQHGQVLTDFVLNGWVQPDVPGGYAPGARKEMGHVTLTIRLLHTYPQVEMFGQWRDGNIMDPAYPMRFREAYIVIPGGPRMVTRFPDRTDDVTLGFGEECRITLAPAATLNGKPKLYFHNQLFDMKWRTRCSLPGTDFLEHVYFGVDQTQPFHARSLETAYQVLLSDDAETSLGEYLAAIDSPPPGIDPEVDWFTNGNDAALFDIVQHPEAGAGLDAPYDFRWPVASPFGGQTSLDTLGPDLFARFHSMKGLNYFEGMHDTLARIADRTMLNNLIPSITDDSVNVFGAVQAHPAIALPYWASQKGKTLPVSFNCAVQTGSYTTSGPTAQHLWRNAQGDTYGMLNVQMEPGVSEAELQAQCPMELRMRNQGNIGLSHLGRWLGRVEPAWFFLGIPTARDMLETMISAIAHDYCHLPPSQASTQGSGGDLWRLAQGTTKGLPSVRELGWSGFGMYRCALAFSPESVVRKLANDWLRVYCQAVAGIQLANGFCMAAQAFGNPYQADKEWAYAWGRYPTTDKLGVAQSFQQFMLFASYVQAISWLGIKDDPTGFGTTYGQSAANFWTAMTTLAWGAAEDSPDYRFAVINEETGQAFTTRADIIGSSGYSSRVHINLLPEKVAIYPGLDIPSNDSNFGQTAHLPYFFAFATLLVDWALIDQSEWDGVFARWQPGGITAADGANDSWNWANLHALFSAGY